MCRGLAVEALTAFQQEIEGIFENFPSFLAEFANSVLILADRQTE